MQAQILRVSRFLIFIILSILLVFLIYLTLLLRRLKNRVRDAVLHITLSSVDIVYD